MEPQNEELLSHPDEVTESEAEEGLAMYLEVDDLDDESNGISDNDEENE